ncbi:MAG: cobalt-precorrin 5A hydrolase [Clostridiaceae bacterium]|nr:cobalt-precorrin 5A hydrolase [Clostridiaceae bacterium]
MRIAVISVTEQGDSVAEKISLSYSIDLFSKSNTEGFDINSISKLCMEDYEAVIYVTSTGIAVRSIAPYIKSKVIDPAVIVIDCTGRFAISLLSGHLGGANKLTLEIAKSIGAMPIITTASDNLGFLAPDLLAKENGLEIQDLTKVKSIAALLVAGKKVGFLDEETRIKLPVGYEATNLNTYEGLVCVTNKDKINLSNSQVLKLIRKNIILGIGCKKNYDSEKMLNQVCEVLREYNIDKQAIKCISTVEVKRDERAILNLSQALKCEVEIWGINEVKEVQHKYIGSDFVEKTIGVRVVCEPCVELSGGELLSAKLNIEGMTICIGRYKEELS